MASDFLFMPIRQLSELIRRKQVSPVELTSTCLDRLDTLGPQYNAVVTVTRERAMQQARQAEREIAAATIGPLRHPLWWKDLLATAGGIPTWGGPLPPATFPYDHSHSGS